MADVSNGWHRSHARPGQCVLSLFPRKNSGGNKTRRLYEVLDKQLEGRDYICHEHSIADIAHWSWVSWYEWADINVDGLGNLMRWHQTMLLRPAVQRGRNIPPSFDEGTLVNVAQSMLQK